MRFGRTVQTKISTARERKRKALVKKIVITSSVIFFALILFIFVINRSALRIEKVNVFGTNIIREDEVSEYVNKIISGKYFFLIPKNSVFFYPKEKIKNELLGKFGRIEAVYPAVDNGNTLVVSVSERSPKYLWCGKELSVNNHVDGKCYFMDKTGTIFVKSPDFSPNVFFTFYGPLASTTDPIGATIFPIEELERIISFRDSVSAMGFDSKSFSVLKDGDYEFNLVRSGKILFNKKDDFEQLVDNILLAITSLPLSEEVKSKIDSLLYIDVRFGNKVFYKFDD